MGHLGERAFTTFLVFPFTQVIDFSAGFATTGAGVTTGVTAGATTGAGVTGAGVATGVGAGGATNFTFNVGEEYVKLLALR